MELAPTLLIASLPLLLLAAALWLGSSLLVGGGLRVAARWTMVAAVGVLLTILAERALSTGRAPWTNLQETAITFSAAVAGVFLLLERRYAVGSLLPVVALISAGLVGVALGQPNEVQPLVPALQAPLLLTIHVGAAMLSYAIGGVAFAAAAAEIAQRRAGGTLRLLPAADVTRAAAHRAVLLGFPLLTAAIVLGSVWANMAWRSYWSNDPKELAAAATWLVYGGYLHAAGRRDRWGGLAPWLLLLGFAGVLFTWLGAGLLFVGEHSYAGA